MNFLENWKTNTGFTILGLVVWPVIGGILGSDMVIDNAPIGVLICIIVLSLGILVGGLIYAAAVYPSLFTDKPKAQSAKVISFTNGFFGGIIFGLLWNSNLTIKTKGVSNVVFIVFQCLGIAAIVLTFIFSFLFAVWEYM